MHNLYAHIVECGMEFEWDERKRAAIVAERKLDFSTPIFFSTVGP